MLDVPPTTTFAGDSQDELDATGVIRGICGWHIATDAEETLRVRSDGSRTLALPTMRLLEVISVVDRGGVVVDLAGVDWFTQGVIERFGGWPAGPLTVRFRHGFATPPRDLAALCRSMASHVGASSPAPVSSIAKTQGSKSITRAFAVSEVAKLVGSLTSIEQWVLDRYTLGPQP